MLVAPYAGAWIEMINKRHHENDKVMSHPTRVRGLKSKRIKIAFR